MADSGGGLFRRLIALGDSLSQGTLSAGVSERSQPYGVPALLARQAGARFRLPLLASPGFPSHIDRGLEVLGSQLTNREALGGLRLRPEEPVDNLACAGARLIDMLHLRCAELEQRARTAVVARLIRLTLNPLGRPGYESMSAMDQAVAAEPSCVWMWLGANDVLEGLFAPQFGFTPIDRFARLWREAIDRLLSETTAQILTPTLIDATLAPLMRLWMRRHPLLERRMRRTFAAYNEIIRATDGRRGRVIVIDLDDAFLRHWHEGLHLDGATVPFEVPGRRLRFEPLRGLPGRLLSGGLASYDGLHPTATGYALLTNEVIAQLNARQGLSIPLIDLGRFAAADPLLLHANAYLWPVVMQFTDCTWGSGVARLARRPHCEPVDLRGS